MANFQIFKCCFFMTYTQDKLGLKLVTNWTIYSWLWVQTQDIATYMFKHAIESSFLVSQWWLDDSRWQTQFLNCLIHLIFYFENNLLFGILETFPFWTLFILSIDRIWQISEIKDIWYQLCLKSSIVTFWWSKD